MLDMKEKLVELLGGDMCKGCYCEDCEHENNEKACIEHIKGRMEDHLIAHGVTVQKWISVKDRLPLNDTYVNVTTDGVVVQAYWHNDRFYAFTANGVATVSGVTHWMPLPQPPKGE